MPGCMVPVNRTRTDSGMSRGMIPVAAAKATKLNRKKIFQDGITYKL